MQIEFIEQAPEAQEFVQLRADIGWGELDIELAQASLSNSLYHITARAEGKLIAMARVIGDGAMYFYIQDVIVAPSYQGHGLGHQLMEFIEKYLNDAVKKGATVALLAANGKEPFYKRYGYNERTGTPLGLGMCKFI